MPEPVTIRDAGSGDLPRVVEIERSSFALPWSAGAFRALMRRRDARVIVAEDGGRVVGYAALWFTGGEAELGDLAVDPEHRRRGIGTRLLEAAVETAARRGVGELFLQVRESNEEAIALYADAGFRRVGRRHGYYRVPEEDALVLSRPIPAPEPR